MANLQSAATHNSIDHVWIREVLLKKKEVRQILRIMHKNYKLLILLILLAIASLALNLTSDTKSRADFRVDLFHVADTSKVVAVKIDGKGSVQLTKLPNGTWEVNGKYGMNQNLKTVLLAVLNQVNIRRPVSQIQQEEIAQNLRNSTKVSVQSNNQELTFFVGGNAARTQSYFMLDQDDQPYIVEIPGYRNYISGMFELTEMQWRDRTLFNTLWRSLQSLSVTYPGLSGNDLNIYFEEDFFKVSQVTKMDTVALMSYLTRYELFEANEFIPQGFNAKYDSLAKTTPIAVIELNEINRDKNQRLLVFPKLDDDNYILTSNKEGELSLIDFNRIRQLLSRKEDFQKSGD